MSEGKRLERDGWRMRLQTCRVSNLGRRRPWPLEEPLRRILMSTSST
jgi:hypothetical protein